MRRRRGLVITMAIAIAIMAVLGYAVAERLGSWSRWVVLAAIVLTVVGAMIGRSPNRRA